MNIHEFSDKVQGYEGGGVAEGSDLGVRQVRQKTYQFVHQVLIINKGVSSELEQSPNERNNIPLLLLSFLTRNDQRVLAG